MHMQSGKKLRGPKINHELRVYSYAAHYPLTVFLQGSIFLLGLALAI